MHHSIESMRDRAFTKGRSAFQSDAEYNAALRGEIDDLDEAMEEQSEIERFATPIEAGETFRDVLNATPGLDEGKLDWIAKRLMDFRDKTTDNWLTFPGHFTLRPADDSAHEVIVVDAHGEFTVEIEDALGVVSEIAEAMECADEEPAPAEDPVLADFLMELDIDEDLDDLGYFVDNDDAADLDLACGYVLRHRQSSVVEGKVIVIDDPNVQTWSVYDQAELKEAILKRIEELSCARLEELMQGLPEDVEGKVYGVALKIAAGKVDEDEVELKDEDHVWQATVRFCDNRSRIVFETDEDCISTSRLQSKASSRRRKKS